MLRKFFTILPSSIPVPAFILLAGTIAFDLGCKPDVCKDPGLTAEQLCTTCKPKDDELFARLNPTQLPYPVRRSLERCVDDIHASDGRNFVTKEALRECTGRDPNLNSDTKNALVFLINRSNLMEQRDLENYHALCMSGMMGTPPMDALPPAAPPPRGRDVPMPPPGSSSQPDVAPPSGSSLAPPSGGMPSPSY